MVLAFHFHTQKCPQNALESLIQMFYVKKIFSSPPTPFVLLALKECQRLSMAEPHFYSKQQLFTFLTSLIMKESPIFVQQNSYITAMKQSGHK